MVISSTVGRLPERFSTLWGKVENMADTVAVEVKGEVQTGPPVYRHIGAPSLYREEYCDQLVEYFAARPLGIRRISQVDKSGKEVAREICTEVPTFQGFAASIGVGPHTLIQWEKRHPAFATARARAKGMQEAFFAEGMANGLLNPTGAIFVAKNILGWRDKIDIETTAGQDSIEVGQLKAALQAATPVQLQQFTDLIHAMQAQQAKGIEPAE